jgi:hypothetical protein
MNEKTSSKDRIQYAVDNAFSRGTVALIVWLGAASHKLMRKANNPSVFSRLPGVA